MEFIKLRLEEINGVNNHTEYIIYCPVIIDGKNKLILNNSDNSIKQENLLNYVSPNENNILLSSVYDKRHMVRNRILNIKNKSKKIIFETFSINSFINLITKLNYKIDSWKEFWIPEERGLIERIIIELISFSLDEDIIEPISFSILSKNETTIYFFNIYIINCGLELMIDINAVLFNRN